MVQISINTHRHNQFVDRFSRMLMHTETERLARGWYCCACTPGIQE